MAIDSHVDEPMIGIGQETLPNGACKMSLPRTAADVLNNHTTLEVESLDRIYLKVIQMRLQNMGGIAWFFRKHRGEGIPRRLSGSRRNSVHRHGSASTGMNTRSGNWTSAALNMNRWTTAF